MISIKNISDYGYYGKDGFFDAVNISLVACSKDGNTPVVYCHYDDMVGFKETVYAIVSRDCSKITSYTCSIEHVIKEWNDILANLEDPDDIEKASEKFYFSNDRKRIVTKLKKLQKGGKFEYNKLDKGILDLYKE